MLRMWMYDLAREGTPTAEHLDKLCRLTLAAGYEALGLYLEHRFVYASAPWAAGKDALTPETVAWLRQEHPTLRIIPFVNLLGHMEGFLYTSGGEKLAEERFAGMQACPSNPEVASFARGLLDDVLAAFDDEIVHIGGDETWQLGVCDECKTRDKAELYGGYFGPMASYAQSKGRRPAVWGDMFLDHPSALDSLPKETLIFDWQYFGSPLESARKFIDAGHEVVLSPTIHVYDAPWCHLPQAERNVRDHVTAAHELNAFGVCVTTWEGALFASYETLLPAISGCGTILAEPRSEPKAVDGKPDHERLRISPNDQLPDPYEHDGFQGTQIVEAILAQLVHRGRVLEIVREPDRLKLRIDGKSNGQLPLDLADNVLNRLALTANMDPLKSRLPRDGVIRGTYMDESFELRAEWLPAPEQLAFKISKTGTESETVDYADLTSAPTLLHAYLRAGETNEEWARLMGVELQTAGGIFAFSQTRSPLKARLLLYGNPFLLWLRNREDLLGEPGDKALAVLDRAIAFAPDSGHRGVSEFVKIAIQVVRFMQESAEAYAAQKPGLAAAALAPIRPAFDDLARIARANHLRLGGSLADVERCIIAKEHVERVMRRIKLYGDGSLGYLPSFETISHPKFVPHDQANWWLINRWANE